MREIDYDMLCIFFGIRKKFLVYFNQASGLKIFRCGG